jgi:outer membrane protein TolC
MAKMKLSLPQAINIALQNNPKISHLRALHSLKEMKYELDKLRLFLPEINLTAGFTSARTVARQRSHDGSSVVSKSTPLEKVNVTTSYIEIELGAFNLFNSGRREIDEKILDLAITDSRISLKTQFRSFIVDVISKYFIALTQVDKLKSLNRQLEFQQSIKLLVERKLKRGEVEADELLYAENDLVSIRKDIQDVKFRLKLAEMDLNKILYADLERSIFLHQS